MNFQKFLLQEERKKDAVNKGPEMASVSLDELNQKISTLEKEKNKEEEYRNYMQLERVSLILYHISKCFMYALVFVDQPNTPPTFIK